MDRGSAWWRLRSRSSSFSTWQGISSSSFILTELWGSNELKSRFWICWFSLLNLFLLKSILATMWRIYRKIRAQNITNTTLTLICRRWKKKVKKKKEWSTFKFLPHKLACDHQLPHQVPHVHLQPLPCPGCVRQFSQVMCSDPDCLVCAAIMSSAGTGGFLVFVMPAL